MAISDNRNTKSLGCKGLKRKKYRERRQKMFGFLEQSSSTCKDHIRTIFCIKPKRTVFQESKKLKTERGVEREINVEGRHGLMKAGGCSLTAVMNNIQYY